MKVVNRTLSQKLKVFVTYENCIAASTGGAKVPYSKSSYLETMQKWELIDSNGEPNI